MSDLQAITSPSCMFLTISRFWCLATGIPFTSHKWMCVRRMAKLSIHNFPISVSSGIRSVPDPRLTQHDFRNKIMLEWYLLGEGDTSPRVGFAILVPPASPQAISIHLFQRLLNSVIWKWDPSPRSSNCKIRWQTWALRTEWDCLWAWEEAAVVCLLFSW